LKKIQLHLLLPDLALKIADPAPQPPGARSPGARSPAAFGADDPTAQLAAFPARQAHREGTVGRFEQVVTFIEDIAGRHRRVVEPAERRLRHHQRMVGDNDAGVARRAHVLLDKAAAEMRAGRMDALAAPVGQRIDPPAPDQLGEPAREIAADEVARCGVANPARDQRKGRDGGDARARQCRARGGVGSQFEHDLLRSEAVRN
jgi:hypothetical protein